MGIESYHIPPGLQLECWTLPGLQWESSSLPDSAGNTRGRVKYSNFQTLIVQWDCFGFRPLLKFRHISMGHFQLC